MSQRETLEETLARAQRIFAQMPSQADEILRRLEAEAQGPRSAAGNRRVSALWYGRLIMSRNWRIAAGIVAALMLMATGWAAERVYQGVIEGKRMEANVRHAPMSMPPIVTTTRDANGTVTKSVSGWGVSTIDETGADLSGRKHGKELNQLIAQKKYAFVQKKELISGEMRYIYKFAFSDGVSGNLSFGIPLDDVKSLEDYDKKYEKAQQERQEAISKAVAAGRFRLIDIDLMLVHICDDLTSGKGIDVQRVVLQDGSQKAIATERIDPNSLVRIEGNKVVAKEPTTQVWYETTWKEHLQAVREGRRKLLGERIVNSYTYEITLADGTKTIFNYGGQEPLEKMYPKSAGP